MKTLRLLAASAALAFLMSASPAAATLEDEGCGVCANCGHGCLACASYVMHALGNCCGAIGGWASCVNTEWGFYVDCANETECKCNSIGENCNSEFRFTE